MKKTVIALSLAGLFSTGAMANSINVDIDNSVPHVPDNGIEIPVERPQPVDPGFGITPDNTPDRPQLADPDFGVTPDSNVPDRDGPNYTPERPQPADPSFGVGVPTSGELVADLEQRMNHRFDEMSEHMDGIRAGLHAVTNARPYVTNGEFAIGAGVGFAGSKEALAIGGAYGLSEKVSLSGTFHYETSGKISGSEVAGGMGIQYKF
ncbi:YadA C-terminal domain-containing protein [Enterovibrio sp. ZSDZ35]|uniref:YadA C-terminal domain-containing protein n=1 Tax=Enterovibrio qingdaonensis TaxID=2899818 RepID=A0ABT5QRL7_9GAMM|nr:YadA C-terminal domain-containing protein [Enterovibrio sp. ZSDZ35]MDD1783617.1 YadA C-terminal domain-containing protein [Enterovibrio sp. ZSDZ35]